MSPQTTIKLPFNTNSPVGREERESFEKGNYEQSNGYQFTFVVTLVERFAPLLCCFLLAFYWTFSISYRFVLATTKRNEIEIEKDQKPANQKEVSLSLEAYSKV